MLVFSTLALTSCGGNTDNTTDGGTSTPPVVEDTTPPTPPTPPAPTEKTTTVKGAELNSYFNYNLTFNKAVDKSQQQAELLANDLIYRLTALYGGNRNEILNKHTIEQKNGDETLSVVINKSKIVTTKQHKCNNETYTKGVALCPACYQETIDNVKIENGLLDCANGLIIINAINGEHTSLINGRLAPAKIPENAWLCTKPEFDKASFVNKLQPIVKRYLNNEDVIGDIANLVYSDVIGQQIYQRDNDLYKNYFINENQEERIIKGGAQTRLYKGYDVTVPAIIETALQKGSKVYKVFSEKETTTDITQSALFNSCDIKFSGAYKVKSISFTTSDANVNVYNAKGKQLNRENNAYTIKYPNTKQFCMEDVLTFTFSNVTKPFTISITELVIVE